MRSGRLSSSRLVDSAGGNGGLGYHDGNALEKMQGVSVIVVLSGRCFLSAGHLTENHGHDHDFVLICEALSAILSCGLDILHVQNWVRIRLRRSRFP